MNQVSLYPSPLGVIKLAITKLKSSSTSTLTESTPVQPLPSVAVNSYITVTTGLAIGPAVVESLNVIPGDH